MKSFNKQLILIALVTAIITIGILSAGTIGRILKEAYYEARDISLYVYEILWQKQITDRGEQEEKEARVVVFPSTDENKEMVEKIKDSFSDEVEVEFRDKNSGVITPIFREGPGEEYLYIIVPTAE